MKEQSRTIDNIGITYVNAVMSRGHFNSVINISLGVITFDPTQGKDSDTDLVVACRLRMDEMCAMQLYEELGQVLQSMKLARKTMEDVHPLLNGKAN